MEGDKPGRLAGLDFTHQQWSRSLGPVCRYSRLKLPFAFAVVMLTLIMSTSARAETPEMTHDLKCLALSFTIIQSNDAKVADAGKIATFYYLGRIDGRDPTIDLADRFSQPDMQLSQEELQRLAMDCGKELSERGKALTETSRRLEAAGF